MQTWLNFLIEKYARYCGAGVPSVRRDLNGKSLEQRALTNKNEVRRTEMTDEEYMMFPAKLYGFSLADRKWSTSTHAFLVAFSSDHA